MSKLIREEAPQGIIDAARHRTSIHVAHMNMVDFDLKWLAINCYLQGARDMAETMINRNMLKTDDQTFDYQI